MPKSESRPANSARVKKLAKPEKVTRTKNAPKKLSAKSALKVGEKSAKAAKDTDSGPYVALARPELLKQLVSNDEAIRENAFKAVSQSLKTKRTINGDDLQKLWKGLWYTMWHSDTPLVQQAFARDLAALFGEVASSNYLVFVDSFWKIFAREWGTLDKWRINKFYMLVRLVLNALLTRIANSKWNAVAITDYVEFMTNAEHGPLSYENLKVSHGLRLHLADIYVDELDKVFDQKLPSFEVIEALLRPVTSQLEMSKFKHVKKRVEVEVMADPRLVEWGIVTEKPQEVEEESDFEAFD